MPFALSYDGMTGMKEYGSPPPKSLDLRRAMINGGRSTQSTLLGRSADTHEALYLSPHVDGVAHNHHMDTRSIRRIDKNHAEYGNHGL